MIPPKPGRPGQFNVGDVVGGDWAWKPRGHLTGTVKKAIGGTSGSGGSSGSGWGPSGAGSPVVGGLGGIVNAGGQLANIEEQLKKVTAEKVTPVVPVVAAPAPVVTPAVVASPIISEPAPVTSSAGGVAQVRQRRTVGMPATAAPESSNDLGTALLAAAAYFLFA